MYKHFLITRFNLNYSKSNSLKPVSEEWISSRLAIFQRFCLPSILNQSNKNFTWFLYFDTNTPEKYKQVVADLEASHLFIKAVYIENADMLIPSLNKEIKERLEVGTEYVITTRMDNDDGLHKHAINTIQQQFKNQSFAIVNLNNGLQIGINGDKCRMSSFYYISNPFVSMIEKLEGNNPLKTILCKDHVLWIVENKEVMVNVDYKYLWLQVIHSQNWLNQFAGKPYRNVKILGEFGINYSGLKYQLAAYISDTITFHIKRIGRGVNKLTGKK